MCCWHILNSLSFCFKLLLLFFFLWIIFVVFFFKYRSLFLICSSAVSLFVCRVDYAEQVVFKSRNSLRCNKTKISETKTHPNTEKSINCCWSVFFLTVHSFDEFYTASCITAARTKCWLQPNIMCNFQHLKWYVRNRENRHQIYHGNVFETN